MHWLHSLDQMVYQIGGRCFTVDEYARVLWQLREDRKFAMASAFAESKRSESRQVQSQESANSESESPTLVLRSKAVLLEESARHSIAQPALDAARIELAIIDRLCVAASKFLSGDAPKVFYTVQHLENCIALRWKSYLEIKSYGALQPDTLSDLLTRGIPVPVSDEFAEIKTRDEFLTHHSSFTGNHFMLTSEMLKMFYTCGMEIVEQSPLMAEYANSLISGNSNEAFLGILPSSQHTLGTIAPDSGRTLLLQDRPART